MFRGEVRKRHFVSAADFGVDMVDLASEPVWWEPFSHRVGIKKRPVDSLWRCPEYAMKTDCVRSHDFFTFPCAVMTNFDMGRSIAG